MVKAKKASSLIIKVSKVEELPYLQVVIKEGIYIWPTVIKLLAKVVLFKKGDTVEIDNKQVYLPRGINIGYYTWGIHYNKDIFSEDIYIYII